MNLYEEELIFTNQPDLSKIPGGISLKPRIDKLSKTDPYNIIIGDEINLLKGVLSVEDCDNIIDNFERAGNYAPVTMQGMQNVTDDNIGSNRITAFAPTLSELIYKNIEFFFKGNIKTCNQFTSTDWWQPFSTYTPEILNYIPVTCSPLLRFMKYVSGGKHYPHYDAGYIYEQNKSYRTLKSFVLYLTTNDSGATRFLEDNQKNLPVWDRDHKDWIRESYPEEILHKILPVKGDMLVFDHRICHDVEEFLGNESKRIIIRGDIIYKQFNMELQYLYFHYNEWRGCNDAAIEYMLGFNKKLEYKLNPNYKSEK